MAHVVVVLVVVVVVFVVVVDVDDVAVCVFACMLFALTGTP